MTILKAKDFNTRSELETKVASMTGLTTTPRLDHVIKGTRNDLKRLFLSHGKIFWGIKCEQTGSKELVPVPNKVNRDLVPLNELICHLCLY